MTSAPLMFMVASMRSLAIMRRFAPVVYDVTHSLQLPGAAGEDVARAVKRASPPALVIVMSGGLAPDDVSVIEGPAVDAALPKPVDLGRLSRAIGDAVARSRTAAI